MPKKTRRQKILAEQRRHAPSVPSLVTQSVHTQEPTSLPTFHFEVSHAPAKSGSTAVDSDELSVIHKDLAKTLILALIAVTVELVMSRVLHGT